MKNNKSLLTQEELQFELMMGARERIQQELENKEQEQHRKEKDNHGK